MGIKITQISAYGTQEDASCYGLDAEGNLYHWEYKRVDLIGSELEAAKADKQREFKFIYGWVLQVDEINK